MAKSKLPYGVLPMSFFNRKKWQKPAPSGNDALRDVFTDDSIDDEVMQEYRDWLYKIGLVIGRILEILLSIAALPFRILIGFFVHIHAIMMLSFLGFIMFVVVGIFKIRSGMP